MKMNHRILDYLYNKTANVRAPDVIIGDESDPYLYRWHVIPRNPIFNVYLHKFLRSDDDRALHDHPWINMSYLLLGEYVEIVPSVDFELDRSTTAIIRRAGDICFRGPKSLHRISLMWSRNRKNEHVCWTLFVTGPRVRRWGFACPKGWVDYEEFGKVEVLPDGTTNGTVGRGCD